MRRDRISKLAVRRCQYTGETYQQARDEVQRRHTPLRAAAGAAQREFEAALFHEVVDSPTDFTEHAFGFRRVRPFPDRVELEVESQQVAERLLHAVLAVSDPDGEVRGVLGLRVRQRTAKGIEVHQAGRATSAWLTGLSPAWWRRAEAAVLEETADLAWRPLWRGPQRWAPEEAEFDRRWNRGEWAAQFTAGAWCSSGLLRRLPLFHTVLPVDVVSGHKGLPIAGYEGNGPVRWCLSLDHRRGVPYLKDELVQALTDPQLGLPVAVAHHLDAVFAPDSMGHCLRLDDARRTGLIELRFGTFDYPRLRPGAPDPVSAAVRQRVEALLARREATRPPAGGSVTGRW